MDPKAWRSSWTITARITPVTAKEFLRDWNLQVSSREQMIIKTFLIVRALCNIFEICLTTHPLTSLPSLHAGPCLSSAGPENLHDKKSRVLKLTPDDSWGLLMGFWQDLVGTTKRKNKLCPYELLLQACTLFENCWNEAVLKFSLLWFGILRLF